MCFRIIEINPTKFKIYNKNTGFVYCYANSLFIAIKQVKLLVVLTHGRGYIG
jgi:hypothetical protein